MLLAYIDEIGDFGAFISPQHHKYRGFPAYGYGGFVIDEAQARSIGQYFTEQKRRMFREEISESDNPAIWEMKGADLFRPQSPMRCPYQIRVFLNILQELHRLGGFIFYYAQEKPVGTPTQVGWEESAWERQAMQETLNRLARHADSENSHLLVIADSINEKKRLERVREMYAHIYARSASNPEMYRLLEPPMHLDSALSSNIQLADWIVAWLRKLIDFHLLRESRYKWVSEPRWQPYIHNLFTYESKLHLHQRSVPDFNHSDLLQKKRPLFPLPHGHFVGSSVDPDVARKMRGIAEARMKKR